MTQDAAEHDKDSTHGVSSLSLPFDAAEMVSVRMLPAEYARLLGVSKQSVSRWIKAGKIPAGFDGRIDPVKATRQLLRNTEPGLLRSRVLVAAMDDLRELRTAAARVVDLESELARSQKDIAFYRTYSEDADSQVREMMRLLIELEGALRETPDTTSWLQLLKEIESASTGDAEPQLDDAWLADLDSEIAAEIKGAVAEYNQLESEARSAAEAGAGAEG